MNRAGRAGVAFAIALGSVAVHRSGTDIVLRGREGPANEAIMPRISGGWPAPYLFDSEGISVPRALGPEDEFRPAPFAATWAFWFVMLSAIVRAARALRGIASRDGKP